MIIGHEKKKNTETPANIFSLENPWNCTVKSLKKKTNHQTQQTNLGYLKVNLSLGNLVFKDFYRFPH